MRTEQYRLDGAGNLFDIEADPGQYHDVSKQHAALTRELVQLAEGHRKEMAKDFAKNADRPFTVGYHQSTTLPARDGVEHGTIERSAKAPNNSFFQHWTSVDDSITWDIEVLNADDYEVTVFYTCAEGDQGAVITAAMDDASSDKIARGTSLNRLIRRSTTSPRNG